jgi:hypothetical protein
MLSIRAPQEGEEGTSGPWDQGKVKGKVRPGITVFLLILSRTFLCLWPYNPEHAQPHLELFFAPHFHYSNVCHYFLKEKKRTKSRKKIRHRNEVPFL